MHPEVYRFFEANRSDEAESILEFGSLNVNGDLKALVPNGARHIGVDLRAGPGVDVVHDCSTYKHSHPVDEVWCADVLEHAQDWRGIIANAARNLVPAGRLVLSCAGPGFHEHGAWGDASPGPAEHYQNVEPEALEEELDKHFSRSTLSISRLHDVQVVAIK